MRYQLNKDQRNQGSQVDEIGGGATSEKAQVGDLKSPDNSGK